MARTSTKAPAIEAKALSASSKSEGMRLLYDNGYSVAQVAKLFKAPYGFAYGVADRHGVVETAASRRAVKAPAVKVTKVARAARTTKAPARKAETTSATARVAAKLAKGKSTPVAKPGRPTAARRAANRKVASKA